ncbi:MAG: IclR family transcriptional regulator [Chthoniobacterales bacterium]
MSVAAVKKAFLLLETISNADNPLQLRELSKLVNLPKPTAYRLLQTLRSIGYLTQDETNSSYQLSDGIHRLVPSHPYALLRMRARDTLENLHKRFNETVNLGVLEGDHISYVDYIETTHQLRLIARPGETDPIYSTALGRAILAQLPENEVEQLIRRSDVKRRTNHTLTDCGGILALITQTANKGWAEEIEENIRGICCMAVCLADWGFPYAAISIAVPKSRLDGETHRAMIAELKKLKPNPPKHDDISKT